jgi:hypothetical protein
MLKHQKFRLVNHNNNSASVSFLSFLWRFIGGFFVFCVFVVLFGSLLARSIGRVLAKDCFFVELFADLVADTSPLFRFPPSYPPYPPFG